MEPSRSRFDELKAEALTLPVEDRIRLAEALWDSVPVRDDEASMPDWQRAILDERLDEAEREPGVGRPWSEVRAAILRGDER